MLCFVPRLNSCTCQRAQPLKRRCYHQDFRFWRSAVPTSIPFDDEKKVQFPTTTVATSILDVVLFIWVSQKTLILWGEDDQIISNKLAWVSVFSLSPLSIFKYQTVDIFLTSKNQPLSLN
ncbi:hypothetical protein EUTSA_v10028057mg [Eutrema salsugineum]|uniref:Uncharacterized protein n=1 Tax=Eutrema salsugineum TaxID=72664 RepID=V4LU06_EUTSA|nr:hypothetical protein EUTSA_v10028057mg [Eutrema salsugineum]